MLKEHRARQQKLLPLFAPELRATRMAFAKGIWDLFLIFTCVYWISISFLYGAGYDTMRHIKDASVIFRNFDDSPAARDLSAMIVEAYEDESMPLLHDFTERDLYDTKQSIRDAVWRGDAWAAVYINEGFGEKMMSALTEGTDYDPTTAVTLMTEESRHFFKVMVINKGSRTALTALEGKFAERMFEQLLAGGANASAIVNQANPNVLITPYSYTEDNIAPYHFDMSMYILSVTLSLCMVVGSFIPSNMWKSIEEPFFKQVRIPQIIALRCFINVLWAIVLCLQGTGIVFAFHGPSWSPSAGDFFAIWGIFTLNTLAFTFFIDCMQNWVHPKFLLGGYFTTLFVNIAAAIFGAELNNHFFRICYAMPFHSTGFMLRTLLTDGSYNKLNYAIPLNFLLSLFWWAISTFLIARKARLVADDKMLMSNVPPPAPEPAAHPDPAPAEKAPFPSPSASGTTQGAASTDYSSSATASSASTPGSSRSDLSSYKRRQHRRHSTGSESDIEIEDA
ncbi:hypothetical protein GGF46_004062 [Coemansia sp. RSA 552]|nr:hypothetical protein GGF46_004062 [Coemansia sp. RSA 552]